jgi:hypothetical protein
MIMKLIVFSMATLLLCGVAIGEGFRFQIAECAFITAGDEAKRTIYNTRVGISKELPWVGESGALYSIILGKYGESGLLKGGDLEFAFFPSPPTGHGVKVFFVAGANVTTVEDADPITYLQYTSGMGLYWDITSSVALWGAFKLEESEDLTTVHTGVGLSIAPF